MGLWQYILRRIALAILVLFIVSVATFVLAHAVPGDPVNAVISERQADKPEIRQRIEARYGLNKPLPIQYAYYLRNLLRGDFGETITTQRPVASELGNFVPATIELTIGSMIFALGLGIPLGIIAAVRQDRLADNVARFVALLGTSVPVFWLGLILSYVFFYRLRILPGSGQLDVGMEKPPHVTGLISVDALLAGQWNVFWSLIRHIILPSIVLGSYAMGIIARMLRSSLVAAMSDDYVRTARAKGVSERRVVTTHALRNALIPTVTVIGLTFASLLAGAVLTETIFSWPGVGQFSVRMALKLDYPGLLGVTFVIAVAYVLVNLIVDILYGVLDPRIRVS
ncbi:MAG TPA: ABC transporter permease [Thermomicrobiales bacterium]|jgi:peptide/nickel transport system permease protein